MWTWLLVILVGILVYWKLIRPCRYWKDRGIVHVTSWPLVGSMGAFVMRKKHFVHLFDEIYKKFPNERYVGLNFFTRPSLFIRDLDLIKQIGVKDFDHFPDHMGIDQSSGEELVSKTLINLKSNQWRHMRATLSPAFTSSKMKSMYLLIDECARNFANHYHGKEAVTVEMKDIFTKFTNDVIATAAFGIKTDSLNTPDNEFYKMGLKFTNFSTAIALRSFFVQFLPRLAKMLGMKVFPEDCDAFFRDIIQETIKKRESEGIVRPDMIHLLMEARKGKLRHEAKEEKSEGFAVVEESHIGKDESSMLTLSDDEIVAQALIFFFAGFDTVSTATSFLAHELAVHPDIQAKLQEEIDRMNSDFNGKVPYNDLLSMKYLDQVISETLRMWPPAFQTDRVCIKDYVIEAASPNEKPIKMDKGSSVLIPIYSLHRDPNYFPDPDRFDPDRFSDENKHKIVPGSYQPFGIGPRNCIGSRFALLEAKTLFFHLLSKFDIVVIEKTEVPLKLSPKNGMRMGPESGFWLGFKPRKITTL